MYMHKLLAAFLAAASIGAAAQTRILPLVEVGMETIAIQGKSQKWEFTKVCIDGQAYLLVLGVTSPNGISPSFKDGKPEQCQVKTTR